jgi:hypothetical protein
VIIRSLARSTGELARFAIVPALCLLALASCGEQPASTDQATPASPPTIHGGSAAARLVVPEAQVAAGSALSYGIANRGDVQLTFGVCGSLERRESSGWSDVSTNTACIELAQILRPGQTDAHCCSIELPGDVEAGDYRLVHTVNAGGKALRLPARIQVAGSG